jgi:hypothetical protein
VKTLNDVIAFNLANRIASCGISGGSLRDGREEGAADDAGVSHRTDDRAPGLARWASTAMTKYRLDAFVAPTARRGSSI